MDEASRRLHELYTGLADDDRASLLAFAEFLAARGAGNAPRPQATAPRQVPAPLPIERPEQESVIAGLKRLASTYPMLDKSEMLGATSDMVATHLLQGTRPDHVIDELEKIFREHYDQLLASSRND